MADRYPTGIEGISHRVSSRTGKPTFWALWRDQDDRRRYQRCHSLDEAIRVREQKQAERQQMLKVPRRERVAKRLAELLHPTPQAQGFMHTAQSWDEQPEPVQPDEWW